MINKLRKKIFWIIQISLSVIILGIIIIFAGNVKDFDNQQSQCQWNIPANPNETVGNLILRFFQINTINFIF